MKRFVTIADGRKFDTQNMLKNKHIELFYKINDKLFIETIDGATHCLGEIIKESDTE